MSTDPKFVERVLKLLALASGTSFGAEAAAARAKAEELIAKHNIQLPSEKDRSAISRIRYSPHFKGAQWEFLLTEKVSRSCGCEFFFNKERFEASHPDDAFSIVGTIADLEACQYLLAALNEQRIAAWLRAKREGKADSFYSFCFSFARAVEANLRKAVSSEVVARQKRALLWYEENFLRPETVDMGFRGQGRSEAGREAGAAASLDRGKLGGSAPVRQIGYTRRLP